MVEAQHRLATARLVDDAEEQMVLEELLERSKPPVPAEAAFAGLHYLLATPFRYPPLRRGSRFGSADERGIWYGALELPTVLAEVAFYRLLFLHGTAAAIDRVATTHTAFSVRVATHRGVDLRRPAFAARRAALTAADSHAAGRAFGRILRGRGVEVLAFPSARAPDGSTCVAVWTPAAFPTRAPEAGSEQVWQCVTTRGRVVFWRDGIVRGQALGFERARFEVDGALPWPS